MSSKEQGERTMRSPEFKRALGELLVVGGACLAMIFWIIPAQTSSGGELGLSPQLVPTVCAAAIGLLTLFRFIGVFLGRARLAKTQAASPGDARSEAVPIRYALSIMLATAAGIAAIAYLGWVVGAALLSLLIILILGERRLPYLAAIPILVAVLMFLIQKTGI